MILTHSLIISGSECADPNCECKNFKEPNTDCSLNKPQYMVVPSEGLHISCPVHGKHFVIGSRIINLTEAQMTTFRLAEMLDLD